MGAVVSDVWAEPGGQLLVPLGAAIFMEEQPDCVWEGEEEDRHCTVHKHLLGWVTFKQPQPEIPMTWVPKES